MAGKLEEVQPDRQPVPRSSRTPSYFVNQVPRDLSLVFLNGEMPNNALNVGLGQGDALQLGFDIVHPLTLATSTRTS